MNSGTFVVLLLIAATGFDFYRQQIPNWLVGFGISLSLVLTLIFPTTHWATLDFLSGLVVGILLFLPLFLIGKMGAGDIKLLGMAGSFVGPVGICWGALFSLIAGGVLAGLWLGIQNYLAGTNSVNSGAASPIKCGSKDLYTATGSSTSLASHPRRMPYAAAITIGCTLAYLGFRHQY